MKDLLDQRLENTVLASEEMAKTSVRVLIYTSQLIKLSVAPVLGLQHPFLASKEGYQHAHGVYTLVGSHTRMHARLCSLSLTRTHTRGGGGTEAKHLNK